MPCRRILAFLALAAGSAAQMALPPAGAPIFQGSAMPAPTGAHSQLAADFNDDGYPDVAVGNQVVSVGLNNGHGLLLPAGQAVVGLPIEDLAAGDLDGDGHTDLAYVAHSYELGVFSGTGDGHLVPSLELVEPKLVATVLMDLNADGALDIVGGFSAGGTLLRLLPNDGSGGFGAPISFGSTGFVADLATGDFDLDGDADLLVSHSTSPMEILENATPGLFQETEPIATIARKIGVGDVDADGWPDIVNHSPTQPTLEYRRNADGSFPVSATKTWTVSWGPLAIGDLAADGLPEIIVSGISSVRVAHNTDGLPGDLAAYPLLHGSFDSLDTADFDGDGGADVLVSLSSSSVCGIALSSTAGEPMVPVVAELVGSEHLPAALDAADLDGDGLQDVVLATFHQTAFYVGLATSPTTFTFTAVPSQYATWPDLHLVDVTSDGNVDAVFDADVFEEELPDHMVVHAGDGAGGFGSALLSSFIGHPEAFEPGDFDSDGLIDVAVLCYVWPELMLRKGDGHGAFTPWSSLPDNGDSAGVRAADMDGDGALDLVIFGSSLSVAYGDGAGNLAAPVYVMSGPGPDGAVHVQDLDADGDQDVASTWYADASLAVLRNDGGNLAAPIFGGLAGAFPIDIACGDVDGDGALDLVQNTKHQGSLVVVTTDGACGLEPASMHPSVGSSDPNSLVLRDLDADGRLDALRMSYGPSAVAVHLNTGGAANPWISVGGGVDGAAGQPRLRGTGEAVAGQLVHGDIDFAPPLTPTVLVLGGDLLGLPVQGGLLVPAPALLFFAGPTSGTGELSFAGEWPAGVPSGVELWMQAWLLDPRGLAATGGLRLLVP